MVKRFTLIVFLILTEFLSAQNPYFINYSIADGLPSSNVYSVSQDEFGYIWFTTDVGIAKYNGHRFELINMENGLSDNEVFNIKRDYKGRYWMMTLNGKTSYIYKGKIYNENNSSLVKKIVGKSYLNDFYQDHKHNIYFLYKNGDIIKVLPNDKVVVNTNYKSKFGKESIWENNNRMYFLNSFGIYDYETKKPVQLLNNENPLFKVYHNHYGNYFSIFNKLYKVDLNNKISILTRLPDEKEIINIFCENENKIWICTRRGIYLLENNSIQKSYFNDDTITSMLKDTEDGYWISTLNRGALYIPSFDIFNLTDVTKINCISSNSKKEIWFGDDFNNYYIFKNNSITKQSIFENKIPVKISRIRFFNDNTYITGKTGTIKIEENGKNIVTYSYANDILENGKHLYYASGMMFRIDKKDFEKPIHNNDAIWHRRTNVITKGVDNDIWFGTGHGLNRYNPKDSIKSFGTKNPYLSTTINDLFFDENNKTLYIASVSKGVIALKNEQIIKHFTTTDGLNSNSCNKITKINPNLFLIGSNNGLNSMEFNNDNVQIKNLNSFIGLKNNKINDIHFIDGIVYLATDNGLLYFNRNKIISRKTVPKCLIVNLKNQNKTVLDTLLFQYPDNEISIEFNGISFINQGELTYFYRLNKNETWKTSKELQVNYQSLPADKYKFEVFCQDQLGNKSNIASISFEILAPFWQKTGFILLMLLLFLVVLYFFIQFWLRRQQRRFVKEKAIIQMERDKANLEKQMIELEQKALRLQMNPHFIFNALNTIKGYYSEGDSVNASSYISKFSKLLRMLLENTEQVIPLSKEIEMLELYIHLNKIRYNDKFEYKLIVDEKLNTDEITIPTLLLQPMVENAIIHGLSPKNEKGILTVSFLKKDNQLECIVEDNGVGRISSKNNSMLNESHQSKAIEITTERLNLFGKNIGKSTIEIIDLQDKKIALGTIVIIKIPLISIW